MSKRLKEIIIKAIMKKCFEFKKNKKKIVRSQQPLFD